MTVPVRVRCTNPQARLDTGRRGGRSSRTAGRLVVLAGRAVQLRPTHERCPRCGGRVEVIPPTTRRTQ